MQNSKKFFIFSGPFLKWISLYPGVRETSEKKFQEA